MDTFRFAPELFEYRNDVIAALAEAGFDWLTHYSSVDPLHDVYGIEVCGIHEKEDATQILLLLIAMFPSWTLGWICYKDYGREPGWKAKIHRDSEPPTELWVTAE